MPHREDPAPGWEAVDSALAAVYGNREPVQHWGTAQRWAAGGPDPLDGISVYARSDPVPHWHYVSYGLSELYRKEREDPLVSGWGFELTARLRRGSETEPPVFLANVLQNLARYVYETGNVFSPGHSMDLFGPIREGSDTAIRAAMFYNDPELEDFLGPFGHVRFLQIVGITEDERAAIRTWDATAVAPILSEHLPLLVTDLGRRSLLSHPEVDRAIVEGRTKNGSSLGALRISTLSVRAERRFPRRPAMVTLPATVVDSLCLLLPLRIPFGRAFMLTGAKESLTVFAGAFYTLMKTPRGWNLSLTDDQAEAVAAALRPVAGTYEVPGLPELVFRVERTAVRDQQGNVTGHIG